MPEAGSFLALISAAFVQEDARASLAEIRSAARTHCDLKAELIGGDEA
jgi:hypothetical protein